VGRVRLLSMRRLKIIPFQWLVANNVIMSGDDNRKMNTHVSRTPNKFL